VIAAFGSSSTFRAIFTMMLTLAVMPSLTVAGDPVIPIVTS
jgi:hypothetical protein